MGCEALYWRYTRICYILKRMNKLALKAWFCALLLLSAGLAGAWQSPPSGESMPCEHQAAQLTQSNHQGHHASPSEAQEHPTHASDCQTLGLCCLGSCMAPIAVPSKPLQSLPDGQLSFAPRHQALTQAPLDPHFRPPIAA